MEVIDSVVLITGGASGLGEATARLLVAADAKVALLDLNEDKGAALATELGDAAIFCLTDVTNENDVCIDACYIYIRRKSFPCTRLPGWIFHIIGAGLLNRPTSISWSST